MLQLSRSVNKAILIPKIRLHAKKNHELSPRQIHQNHIRPLLRSFEDNITAVR